MKKMMIALAILGFTWSGAQAQTNRCLCPQAKKAKAHKLAHVARPRVNTVSSTRTYQVCREEGGYYTCCLYTTTTTKPAFEKSVALK